jgi:hypothetical protein
MEREADPRKPRPRTDARGEIKVVDLSQTPPNRRELSPLEGRIVEALREAVAGILSRDELLGMLRGHSLSEVEQALRDLSLRGLVRVLWQTPFRFMAFLRRNELGQPHNRRAPFRAITA